ncbi:hypothetical protein N750_07915 [Legionella pneumophila str. Leg01/53]|nr:hypothetical protein N750_07915 [Legionella pneumophila str. Leg01/53]ERI49544.1 hypothetical protein N749_00105 [Legionella pneumophila str. Leg01/20]
MDKDYMRTSRYPGAVQAEEMHKHRLEAWHKILNLIQGFETT